MMKKKNIEILSSLFEETEQVSLTNEELDGSLLEIGLDPNGVVVNGIERIKKHINLKNFSGDNVNSTIQLPDKIKKPVSNKRTIPMAAKRRKKR
ncbi:hypothetical protein QQ008_21280 [Fulvivirgaceae bacterium BMA10]|uniref:Uncharacterized protein n=1 Tax=Splendidivirga corallicola TaxID=3051826 RepID=A0ABT8KUV1_9BACT|nr:hypothetical protein [Fulvivirgaceae bacterium BMA10]